MTVMTARIIVRSSDASPRVIMMIVVVGNFGVMSESGWARRQKEYQNDIRMITCGSHIYIQMISLIIHILSHIHTFTDLRTLCALKSARFLVPLRIIHFVQGQGVRR